MTSLASVWHQVEKLLSDNVSLIPIRDHDDERGVAKSPFGKWTEFQSRIISKDELWQKMELNNTTAIGMICGAVSGNLEVIDIDIKYNKGIDAVLFKDIQTFYPQIWEQLRIHKTPSGGFHILYRVSDGIIPGNKKLAGRLPTPEEVEDDRLANPNKKKYLKELNFLETRGEAGYIAAPPSLGYAVHADNPIPVITWAERCSLIELCQSYNQIIKQEPSPKVSQTQQNSYELNPFEDFNKRCDPTELVEEFDWKFSHENNKFIWYTRPGKNKGVSLSWNKEKCIYYSFSASTELDAPRGYNASTFLSIYKFNGDTKKTYAYLVQLGYGTLRQNVEQQIIKRSLITGGQLPPNASEQAKEQFTNTVAAQREIHPYGIFWEFDEDDKLKIDRQGLYEVAHALGIRVYLEDAVQIRGNFIYRLTLNGFYDTLKDYIREEDADTYKRICNTFESFMQNSGRYTLSRMRELDLACVLKDTNDYAYKFYRNKFIKVSETEVTEHEYSELADTTSLIWANKIIDRDWFDKSHMPDVCMYTEFIHLAIGITDQLMRVIGYLAHDFKDENTGYIIVMTESCPDPKGGGGSGKNIFGNLFINTTSVCTVSGSQVQFNEKFLQSWNDERIFFMADIPKKFEWSFLKEIATGWGTVKKLFKNERTVSPKDMPKLLANTNFSFDASDGGLRRRIIPIEFTNYFTAKGGVDVHFGGLFPTCWTTEDWIGYDWFMVMCLQAYFKCKGKITADVLSSGGWQKQFKQLYGELTLNFISENFQSWIDSVFIPIADFNAQYDAFCHENNIRKGSELSSILMNRALKEYCDRMNYEFEGIYRHSITKVRGKHFVRKLDE